MANLCYNSAMGGCMGSLRARLKLAILALGILLLGLTPYPRAYAAAVRRAEAHRAAREYNAALDAYREAARLQPESALPWLHRGEVLLAQHRFLQAAVAFEEAERRGGGVEALLGQGEGYAGSGDLPQAVNVWLHALTLAPDDARPRIALGRASIDQGLFDQASRHLDRALQLEPPREEAVTAYALLGRLLIDGDPARAADHLRQAGDQDMLSVLDAADAEPDPARRALLLGAAFLQRDELPLAQRHFEQAVALAPGDAEALAYLAHVLDRTGRTVAAGELLAQALNRDPDSALAYFFLGAHDRRLGDVAGAQAALWEALLRDPDNAAARVEMAETFVDLHDYPGAEEWYRGVVEVTPSDVEFHLLLARFYLDHLYRVEEGGVPAAEAAVALAPGEARAHDLLGWAYHLAGRHAEAEGSLTQALALDPGLVSAHYHLGSLYATTGRPELARRHLQRAADLDTGEYFRRRARAVLGDLQ
jgi:tetratricopeptide (TPR) repeat protein